MIRTLPDRCQSKHLGFTDIGLLCRSTGTTVVTDGGNLSPV
jgi:hypothetical protein